MFQVHKNNFCICNKIVIERARMTQQATQGLPSSLAALVAAAAAAAAATAAAAPGPAAAAGCSLRLPTSAEAGRGEVVDRPLD